MKLISIFGNRQKELYEHTLEDLQLKLEEEKKKQDRYRPGFLNRATIDGRIEMLEFAIKRLEFYNDFVDRLHSKR